jgi:cell wall-associated NlpC family hydrolase
MPIWSRLAAAILLSACVLLPGRAAAQAVPPDPADVVMRALALLGTPYRYGGRAPGGFDCSGLVGYVFEGAGIRLPRRSEDIGRVGTELVRSDLAPGDLVFFNTLGRSYSHVGIYIGDGRFVHAPARRGRVRVERIDDWWLARYDGARRVLVAEPVVAVTAASVAPAAAPPPALEFGPIQP